MRPRLRHRDSSSSHRRILPMVVAAKTYSSFSRCDRLERAFFLDDGLQTTTPVFPGWPEAPDLRARRPVRQAAEDAASQITIRTPRFVLPSDWLRTVFEWSSAGLGLAWAWLGPVFERSWDSLGPV